jgi:hypothetical protein
MYTTLTFKNGIHADILKDEVFAWVYDCDFMQVSVCRRQYKNDDDLLIILDEIRKSINSNNHGEVWDFLFGEFNRDGDSITYAEDGSLIVKVNGYYSDAEWEDILNRLNKIDKAKVGDVNDDDWDNGCIIYRPVYHLGQEVAKIFY